MQDEEQQEFEKYVKEEFDKMLKHYDRVHDVLWGALSEYRKEVENYTRVEIVND